jgi:hypothetical protein
MRKFCATLLGVSMLTSWGCSDQETKETSTQVTLRVQVTGQTIKENMKLVRVTLLREDGGSWIPTSAADFPTDQIRWPLDIPIVPSSSDSAALPFEVIVEARAGERRLAQARAVSGFARGTLRVLEVWLYACSGHEEGFVCAADDCHGMECESCTVGGGCEPVLTRNPGEFPLFSPTETPEVTAPPGWTENTATGEDPDTGEDTPTNDCSVDNGGCSEHATCVDTPEGPLCTCDSEFEDRSGDGTECIEKCALAGCDPHATCAINSGGAVCTCTPPYVGNGKSCSFDQSCSKLTCDPHASCKGSDTANLRCECLPGYTGSGTECENVDECTATPGLCGQNSICSDSDGAYSCSCRDGFYLTSDGCRNVDDCSANLCGGGTCIDGINTYACMCPSGFSGSGTKSCVNIDDCAAKNDCSPGGTCIDGINSYSCRCDYPSYSGTSCRLTQRAEYDFDALTGLYWLHGYSWVPIDGAGSCATSKGGGGWRVPTETEMKGVLDLFDEADYEVCWATTTADVCGPGKPTMGATGRYLKCVR